MNDSKTKFTIKKAPSGLRMKVASSEEVLMQKNQQETEEKSLKLNHMLLNGLTFTSREQKIIKRQINEIFDKEIFSAKYSTDDNKIAVTMLDGSISVINPKEEHKYKTKMLTNQCPATSIIWKNSKQFLVGDTDGNIYELEYQKSENDIITLSKIQDPTEQILALEHSNQLGITLYAGKSMRITILNDLNKKIIKSFEPGDAYAIGHTNRIFAIKFSDLIPNSFISAGWDGTLFMWDVRVNKPVNSIFGPVVSGDSLDIHENMILAGSYRDKDSLELYDIRNYKKICNVDWSLSTNQYNYVSSCKFNKNKDEGEFIIAGSCLSNQVGIFKKEIVYTNEVIISGMKKGVYTSGFANSESKFFFGTSDGEFNVFHYFNL